MQVTEKDAVILFYSDLRGEWPEAAAAWFLRSLPYAKRLLVGAQGPDGHKTLAGVSLARRALAAIMGHEVAARDFMFPDGGKPYVPGAVDFSIAHSGPWVGCAVAASGRIGFDVECQRPGIEQTVRLLVSPVEAPHLTPRSALERWVATEAALKAFGASLREASAVEFRGAHAFFRGEPLYRGEVDVFTDAAACVMTSQRASCVDVREVPLSELFPSV
jgi:phosphopantetheinyl transferase